MTRRQFRIVNAAYQAALAASPSMRAAAERLYLERLRRALREESHDHES